MAKLTWVFAFLGLLLFIEESSGADQVRFDQFPAGKVYTGPTRFPDFRGRDRAFADYRTRIRDGLKSGPNFAAHYSVIQFGCGTGCSEVYVADNKTGHVFRFPRGGEDNQALDLSFKQDSLMLIAQWATGFGPDDKCTLEYFEWDGDEAKLLDTKTLGSADVCVSRNASDPVLSEGIIPMPHIEKSAAAADNFMKIPLKGTYGNESGCNASADRGPVNDDMQYISPDQFDGWESSCRFVAVYAGIATTLAAGAKAWTVIVTCVGEGTAYSKLMTVQEDQDVDSREMQVTITDETSADASRTTAVLKKCK